MAGPRYIADPPELIRRVELDGLTALFHRPSGMTHILAPPAPQILGALAGKAADLDELAGLLADRFEVLGGAEALTARLAELEAAGLVRRA
jgi:PqqD family protein of HPr-rel-A system